MMSLWSWYVLLPFYWQHVFINFVDHKFRLFLNPGSLSVKPTEDPMTKSNSIPTSFPNSTEKIENEREKIQSFIGQNSQKLWQNENDRTILHQILSNFARTKLQGYR